MAGKGLVVKLKDSLSQFFKNDIKCINSVFIKMAVPCVKHDFQNSTKLHDSVFKALSQLITSG